MTSQAGKQNNNSSYIVQISKSKDNQRMKFDQLIK